MSIGHFVSVSYTKNVLFRKEESVRDYCVIVYGGEFGVEIREQVGLRVSLGELDTLHVSQNKKATGSPALVHESLSSRSSPSDRRFSW